MAEPDGNHKLQQLKELFPDAVHDGAVDYAQIQREVETQDSARKSNKKALRRPSYFGQPRRKRAPVPAGLRTFYMEDVRCFKGRQAFHLRPLTFLIGENSTGKTTMLGCLHALCNVTTGAYLPFRPQKADFNAEPYRMGYFQDIVRWSDPAKNRFELGMLFKHQHGEFEYSASFVKPVDSVVPTISRVRWELGDGTEIEFVKGGSPAQQPRGEPLKVAKTGEGKFVVSLSRLYTRIDELIHILDFGMWENESTPQEALELAEIIRRHFMEAKQTGFELNVNSIGPLRVKPERSYHPVAQTRDPQGADIPTLLMNLRNSSPNELEWLRKQLVNFGKASGLFQDIAIRSTPLGGSQFHIDVNVNGRPVNIAYVGYGISQVLPILVNTLMYENTTFLLQNLEVHLHHRAHAEITSLLVESSKQQGNSFVVETQSDFMVDRARIDIRRGKLNPDDVALIYIEQGEQGEGAKVYNATFDDYGNLEGLPPSYRDFFKKEGDRLLGWVED